MKNFPNGKLLQIQANLHSLMKERLTEFLDGLEVDLPSIDSALASPSERQFLELAEIDGGFSYWLENNSTEAWIMVESWSYAVKGSGQLHRVTVNEVLLIDGELC